MKFETLPAIGMPKVTSPKIVPFAFKFFKTLSRCKKLVKDFRADAVLGMGGFTSLAPLMAGRKRISERRLGELFRIMEREELSPPAKIEQLGHDLAEYHAEPAFENAKTMGELVQLNLEASLRGL